MSNLEKLNEVLEAVKTDAEKFFNQGNASAGTRVRKAMQEVKVLAQAIRNEVTDLKSQNKA